MTPVAGRPPCTGRRPARAYNLDLTLDVLVDGQAVERSRWTWFDAATLLLDMPQVASLGVHSIGVTDGLSTDASDVVIVEPAAPRLELDSGDPLGVVDRDGGLDLRLGGRPGSVHFLFVSPDLVPSRNAFASFDIGNGFSSLLAAGSRTIPAQGWIAVTIPTLPDPGALGMTWYAQSVALEGSRPFPVSNLQSIVLVR